MNAKLKPCPFCGGRGEFMVGLNNFNDVCIQCEGCDLQAPLFDVEKGSPQEQEKVNRKNATKHWNTRT